MSYIDNSLVQGEQVIDRARTHPMAMLFPVLLLFLLMFVSASLIDGSLGIVGVAAEAFAAAFFAQLGYDVNVQYGANQPGYDLTIARDHHPICVSIKGSQDGAWGLIQNDNKKHNSYHDAIDQWAKKHTGLVYCFIQFYGVNFGNCPKAFLATTEEIKEHLHNARNGDGDTILWENHQFIRGIAASTCDAIPEQWVLSAERAKEVFKKIQFSGVFGGLFGPVAFLLIFVFALPGRSRGSRRR